MLIARWHCTANFGHKQEAVDLIKEWASQVGSQTNIDMSKMRLATGSVGASEGLIEAEFEINDLGELQSFFDKIATVQLHKEWGSRMGAVIVSGSTQWVVLRKL